MELSTAHAATLVGLLAATAALLAAARRLGVPYPVMLVLGGLVLALIPGLPHVELPPGLVLVAVLPPLLYSASFYGSRRELRANVRPILLNATGLVVCTMLAVAVAGHAVASLAWAPAFVLGAILAPTDPTAATAIADRVGLHRRIVAIVEGESLVNDGAALTAYGIAVVAVTSGMFSVADATRDAVVSVAAAALVGVVVGHGMLRVRARVADPQVEIATALMSGYFAYVPAEMIGGSGVIAAVTLGLVVGRGSASTTSPEQRLQARVVSETVVLVLNALLFVLVGLQLSSVVDRLAGGLTPSMVAKAAFVAVAVVVVRIGWVLAATGGARLLANPAHHPWRHSVVIAWAGMRGPISLAAALALPTTMEGGEAFPGRDLIIFVVFAVVLLTLVVEGLSLPAIARRLGVEEDARAELEDAMARAVAADAALVRLQTLRAQGAAPEYAARSLEQRYRLQRDRWREQLEDDSDHDSAERSSTYRWLHRELLTAEREAVIDLRRRGRIDDEVLQGVQRDIDLEEVRLRG